MQARNEKVTITLPPDIKENVMKLKKEMNISMNSIYQNAIQEYLQKIKREKIRREAKEMVEEYKTNPEILEMSDFVEDIIEY